MTIEHWLRVQLADIAAVRVICRHCGGVAELPVEQLVTATAQGGECRFCNAELLPDDKVQKPHNPLANLAAALKACAALKKTANVEFLLPPPAKGECK